MSIEKLQGMPSIIEPSFLSSITTPLILKGLSGSGNPKWEFPRWQEVPDHVLPPEFRGKRVSINITLIVR